MVAFHVAAALVTAYQFLRTRDRRLLPLAALFALLAFGHFRGEWDSWGRAAHFAGGIAGLALLALLMPRPPAR
jgi:hypothetical protein